MRSDAPLIRYLSKTYSPRLGWEWQRLPLIELPATSTDEMQLVYDRVKESAPTELRPPFEDFVLDFWQYNDDDPESLAPTLHTWARVSQGEAYERARKRLSPWNLASLLEAGERIPVPADVVRQTRPENALVVIEVMTLGPDGREMQGPLTGYVFGALLTDFSIIPMSPLAAVIAKSARAGQAWAVKAWRDLGEADVMRALNTTVYLTLCPEYLVEVVPEIPAGTPLRRASNPKPWTYDYLPSIILLHPSEAPTFQAQEARGGTHASPRPHQRRGHWAELRHPKYRRNPDGSTRKVFVKPAWVGPREWVMQGNRYRVLDILGETSDG